jgi:hypothetical protein
VAQPVMDSSKGVILTVGFLDGGNRAAIVLPLATDSAAVIPTTLCFQAVDAWQTNVMGALRDCFNEDAQVMYIQGEGMDDGKVPYRVDLGVGDREGTRTAPGIPSNAGALITYYQDPADIVPGTRIRTAHNDIPGQSATDWPNGSAVTGLLNNLQLLADLLVLGFDFNPPASPNKWYRVLAAKKRGTGGDPPATNLMRVCAALPRGYAGTQRRRLQPH